MKRWLLLAAVGLIACSVGGGQAEGRGFGGFRGGGFGGFRGGDFGGSFGSSFGGFRSENFGRSGFDSFEGSRSSSFGGSRWGGDGRGVAGGSYDHSWTGSRGGSVNVAGERDAAWGPRGAVAGGNRDVTATGPGGRAFSGSREGAVAVGPHGRMVGGSEGARTATGPRGTASSNWQSAFAGHGHMSTDFGLAHYSSVNAVSAAHVTTYRSAGAVHAQAGFVRGTFGYYNAFHPAWYAAHPNCWTAARWAAGDAWKTATWATLAAWCAIPAAPVNYDYGNTVVYQDNSVYLNGTNVGTAQEYGQQATAIADAGQKAEAAPEAEWQPLGVFALVQGESTSSGNVFQLALSKDGVIRGNYYDGLLDTTTPVYGSVDKNSQRAAWTIGKKNDRVFEAGIENLTKADAPVLVHIGPTKTQQWTLVRVEQPTDGK
jgi:hypothetical protein